MKRLCVALSVLFLATACGGGPPARPPGRTPPPTAAQPTTSAPSALPQATAPAAPPKTSASQPAPAPFKGPVHYRGRVVVLMFHAFVAGRGGDYLAPATFAKELAAMKAANLQFIRLATFENFVAGKGTVPPNAVLLTMDDGDESVYTAGYPILKKDNIPFTCFLIAGWLGQKGRMTLQQVADMAKSGLLSVGSHTYADHYAVAISPTETTVATVGHAWIWSKHRQESDAAYRAQVLSDLTRARTTLKSFGPVKAFAYPFGAYDPELISLLQQAGYGYAFTTVGGAVTPGADPFRLPRVNVGQSFQTPKGAVATVLSVGGRKTPFTAPKEVIPHWK